MRRFLEPGERMPPDHRGGAKRRPQVLDFQTAFTGRVGNAFTLPWNRKPPRSKVCFFNAGFLSTLGNCRAHFGRCFDVVFANHTQVFFQASRRTRLLRRSHRRSADADVLVRTVHGQTHTARVPCGSLFRTRMRRFRNSVLLLFAICAFLTSSCLLCGRRTHPCSECLCPCRARACAMRGCSQRPDQQAVRQCLPQ